jgi:uncharacterized membrane protein
VLSDLILALPTALLVGLLPGWFWARVLLPSSDLAERAAYSVGLSMALVPSVALALARPLGTGVTLSVAVVSVVAVFSSGLVAYARLGAAKGSEEPMGLPAASGSRSRSRCWCSSPGSCT